MKYVYIFLTSLSTAPFDPGMVLDHAWVKCHRIISLIAFCKHERNKLKPLPLRHVLRLYLRKPSSWIFHQGFLQSTAYFLTSNLLNLCYFLGSQYSSLPSYEQNQYSQLEDYAAYTETKFQKWLLRIDFEYITLSLIRY